MPAYGPDSFWNTPIPSNPQLDPNSSAMVAKALVGYAGSANFANTNNWGRAIYTAKSTDKLYTIHGRNQDIQARIPANAVPNGGSDHHMTVVEGDVETVMWLASHDPATDIWSAGWVGQTSIVGWGAMCGLGKHCSGPTAAGFALVSGVGRPEEFKQGHIDHAFTIATPYTRAGLIACPATHSDGKYQDVSALPEGARIQLDPTFNVDAQQWERWQKVMAKALQKYGAYVADTGGSLSIKGEAAELDKRGVSWADIGVPSGPRLAFLPWAKFRVLKLEAC